ncbi:universal stress protein [Streptomyces sp. NBC_00654]|uniref:universal stress protein n=1 Tax=Streptomyces sp. NBC_00654 TaxID=2975799 RepID=UPI00225468A2|nr:universal stress protein [Streptomyces sp. NBC_00654]MCX4966116.1 universal stress protein [Streptomyces sp. NBC_00654]
MTSSATKAVQGDYEELVLAYDRSPYSDRALKYALHLAEHFGARLHIVHVISLADYPVDPDLDGSELQSVQEELDREHASVDELMEPFTGEWTYTNETGDPVARIDAVGDRYDACWTVIGSPSTGLAGVAHKLLTGSVSHRMVKYSHRPVLVVPG